MSSKFEERVGAGAVGAGIGFIFGGPLGAYIGWKIAGFAVTKNPLHLIPSMGMIGMIGDAMSAGGDIASAAADVASVGSPGDASAAGGVHHVASHIKGGPTPT